jgi:hypothetical protein
MNYVAIKPKQTIRVLLFVALATFVTTNCRSRSVTESIDTTNQTFRVRAEKYLEGRQFGPVNGAAYVFSSARHKSAGDWHEIMTFRHDDPVSLHIEQIRFVGDQVGFVFMGWKYAVTTDAGTTWSVWDAQRDLPNWQCCNYALIAGVQINADGTGKMTLNSLADSPGEVPSLVTKDFGRQLGTRLLCGFRKPQTTVALEQPQRHHCPWLWITAKTPRSPSNQKQTQDCSIKPNRFDFF